MNLIVQKQKPEKHPTLLSDIKSIGIFRNLLAILIDIE